MTENTPNPLFDLAGRTAIITGGGTGIGKIYSQRFAEAGANVVIADIAAKEGGTVAAAITDNDGKAISITTDISDEAATLKMAAAAMDEFGSIDILINNASMMSVLERRPWHEIPVDEWDRVMAVNLRGMFLCCRAAYPHMKKQGSGKIINISSGRFWMGTPNRLHYSTSKAGVIGLTRSLAREVGDDNIAVNAITPGFTESDTQVASSTTQYMQAQSDRYRSRTFKRAQMPDDLVGTVMFLASDASNFITGQTINVDGGENMH
ncbi:MAG: glucose 1-dehydrogenase [Rhodospirillales bacterium]|nr:glucose 1-dehydrogenase [Rhodospirillales bacterium]